jgi:hypothetical protein
VEALGGGVVGGIVLGGGEHRDARVGGRLRHSVLRKPLRDEVSACALTRSIFFEKTMSSFLFTGFFQSLHSKMKVDS